MQEELLNNIIESTQIILTFWMSCNIGSGIGSYLNKSINLKKLSKYEGKLLVDASFIKDNIAKIKEDKSSFCDEKKIRFYLNNLIKYLPNEDKKLLYLNLKTLKIENNYLDSTFGLDGYYDSSKNKLSYSKKSSLGHELIHMASTLKLDEYRLCGFKQRKGKFELGRGINEGYTELIASRLFNRGHVSAYKDEVKIMRLVEMFFDDSKELSHLFFNCNLPGLVDHLEKFSSREEVISLILDVDKINRPSLVLWNMMPRFQFVKTQLTLYDWFSKYNKDPKKQKEFEDVLFEDKLVKFIVQGKKMVLSKEKRYDSKLENEKIKSR